jgi:hypothetical protein
MKKTLFIILAASTIFIISGFLVSRKACKPAELPGCETTDKESCYKERSVPGNFIWENFSMKFIAASPLLH